MKKVTALALVAACMATFAAPGTVSAEETNVSAGRVAQRYEAKDGTWDEGAGTLTLSNGELAKDAFFCDGIYTYYLQHDGTLRVNCYMSDENGNLVYMEGDGSVRGSRGGQSSDTGFKAYKSSDLPELSSYQYRSFG